MAERTCIGCRARKDARDLVRVVVDADGRLAFDGGEGLGGRGAHLCPRRSCFARALKQRALVRALPALSTEGAAAEASADELVAQARQALLSRLSRRVQGARRARQLLGQLEPMGGEQPAGGLMVTNPTVRDGLCRELALVASLSA